MQQEETEGDLKQFASFFVAFLFARVWVRFCSDDGKRKKMKEVFSRSEFVSTKAKMQLFESSSSSILHSTHYSVRTTWSKFNNLQIRGFVCLFVSLPPSQTWRKRNANVVLRFKISTVYAWVKVGFTLASFG